MIIIKCKNCGKEIETYKSRLGRKHFCSRKCNLSFNAKGNKYNVGRIPWNKNKHQLQTSGSNNPNWKNGISKENEKQRHNIEAYYWKRECLARDNFTCQKTGVSGGDLVVHHINNFSEFPELRWEISNGITLSKKSHLEFHKKYGYKNNTRSQIEEFLGVQA
jgi:hypothetical protein